MFSQIYSLNRRSNGQLWNKTLGNKGPETVGCRTDRIWSIASHVSSDTSRRSTFCVTWCLQHSMSGAGLVFRKLNA